MVFRAGWRFFCSRGGRGVTIGSFMVLRASGDFCCCRGRMTDAVRETKIKVEFHSASAYCPFTFRNSPLVSYQMLHSAL